MEKIKKKQLITSKESILNSSKNWFIKTINIYQRIPLPNTTLLSQMLAIIYWANGEPDVICIEIISRGLLKTKSSINRYISFMKRINLLKSSNKKIKITDKYLPK